MANLSGEGRLSVGARLDSAGQALKRVTATRSTSWNVESADPADRTALATERMLELSRASADGIEALVASARQDSKWIKATAVLTIVITLLTAAAVAVGLVALWL
ncbi:MAG: hypothetical protein KDA37_08470 [Planctomycetales bacterium]|nr:hypothetical protein [Planctomycetales bacterium]